MELPQTHTKSKDTNVKHGFKLSINPFAKPKPIAKHYIIKAYFPYDTSIQPISFNWNTSIDGELSRTGALGKCMMIMERQGIDHLTAYQFCKNPMTRLVKTSINMTTAMSETKQQMTDNRQELGKPQAQLAPEPIQKIVTEDQQLEEKQATQPIVKHLENREVKKSKRQKIASKSQAAKAFMKQYNIRKPNDILKLVANREEIATTMEIVDIAKKNKVITYLALAKALRKHDRRQIILRNLMTLLKKFDCYTIPKLFDNIIIELHDEIPLQYDQYSAKELIQIALKELKRKRFFRFRLT